MTIGVCREDILRSTLFHIQMNRWQYIDDFPEKVTTVFEKYMLEKGISEYNQIKPRLYKINTNFFKINNVRKKDFFEGLFQRIRKISKLRG